MFLASGPGSCLAWSGCGRSLRHVGRRPRSSFKLVGSHPRSGRTRHRVHGEKVVILIDEYDAPIHAGVAGGYVREVLDFFRLLLTQGLKGNPHLFKAVLTGILRVAKESIFSGLNNLAVYTLLRPDFATGFGFTEPEVVALLDHAGRRDQLDAVRAWYNGYVFGGEVIYNPWSIVNYVDSPEPEPRPFWISTSANELVRESLVRHAAKAHDDIEALLEGRGVLRRLDENVVLSERGVLAGRSRTRECGTAGRAERDRGGRVQAMRWAMIAMLLASCTGEAPPRSPESRAPVAPAPAPPPTPTAAPAPVATATAVAAVDPREATRRTAHDALAEHCGECHEGHRSKAPKALAVFDLDQPDWPARFDEHRYQAALRRLASKPQAARDAFIAFRDAELAALPARSPAKVD